KQVAFAVIATTTVLVAVFLPVGFMEGNTGRLFRELSVALAGAVALSAFVALTLTPMMSSKLVRPHNEETSNRFNLWINRRLEALSGGYRRWLQRNVGKRWLLAAVMLGALALSYGLIRFVPSELAPAEDRGSFFVSVTGPEGAGFDYTVGQMRQVEQIFADNTGEGTAIRRYNTRVPGGWGASEEMHTGNVIVFLQDWDQRERSTAEVAEELRRELCALPGVRGQPRVGGGRGGGGPAARPDRAAGGPCPAARGWRPGRRPRAADPDRARRPGVRRDRRLARHHDGADGSQPRLSLGRLRLQGDPTADAGGDRPP